MISHDLLSVRLDTIKESDLSLVLSWRNSPQVFKWCRQKDLIEDQEHLDWFYSLKNNPKIKMHLIRDVLRNRPVGVCGITDIDLVNRRAEFSLYIAPMEQGQGFGRDALKLLLHSSFEKYPFQIIWGESFAGNPALKLFQSLGFKMDGIRRNFYFREGRQIDAHLVSIRRHEFKL